MTVVTSAMKITACIHAIKEDRWTDTDEHCLPHGISAFSANYGQLLLLHYIVILYES